MSLFDLSTGTQTLSPLNTTSPALTVSATGGGGGTLKIETGTSNSLFIDGNGNVGIGTTLSRTKMVVEGDVNTKGDIYIGDDYAPPYRNSAVISQENLYTWFGDNPISTTAEPFKSGTYTRIDVGGSATFSTSYYNSSWNGQYMIVCLNMTEDTTGGVASPTNYVRIRLPCKPNVSHALFLKFITRVQWSSAVAYVANQSYTSFVRLQNQANSWNDSTMIGTTSWTGPNGQMSASPQIYHEWLMFSIPQYIIEQYAYSESNDNKSRYGTTINIAFCTGKQNTDGTRLDITGIAIRPNPYGLTFHGAVALHWATNGGTASGWFSGNFLQENLNLFSNGTNYDNIRVPICPPKDPLTNLLPDFYLVIIHFTTELYQAFFPNIYLQNPTNTSDVQYLGQISPCIRGRYGTRLIDANRYACGLIVPSPDPKYIVYVGGRPYLNIRYDQNVNGRPSMSSYSRGFFTEVIDRNGIPRGFSSYGPTPITYVV